MTTSRSEPDEDDERAAQRAYRQSEWLREKLQGSFGRRRKPEIKERTGGGRYRMAWHKVAGPFLVRRRAFAAARALRGRKVKRPVVLRQTHLTTRGKTRYLWFVAERRRR